MSIVLHVNVDHVATLRQARGTLYPDPVEAALLCERAGAHGITVHLREDKRHIQERDVRILRQVVRGTLNLEMAASQSMVDFALATVPDVVTLVPERREERTTEGGLSVAGHEKTLREATRQLQDAGIKVSLFIEARSEQVLASKTVGVDQVEFHTGHYADAELSARSGIADEIAKAAVQAHELGIRVAAGHGLTVTNVFAIARVKEIVELNIGHAIISDAVMVGMGRAVRAMIRAMNAARQAK